MLDLIRRVAIPLTKSGVLGVANEIAGWEAQFKGRLAGAELFLGNTGSTSGATTVDLKLNGSSVLGLVFSIAQAAATKRVRKEGSALVEVYGEPSGVPFNIGDYFQADVTAVPGTPSQDLILYLYVFVVDV